MTMEFSVVIEQDKDCHYVASASALHGSHTQAKSLGVRRQRIQEAIGLSLEVDEPVSSNQFIGLQRVAVTT